MGTETILRLFKTIKITSIIVKLNNPLMGTETLVDVCPYRLLASFRVKLNNPLMGTETLSLSTACGLVFL